jgi:2-polyprenyl-3-methyl-5-hydroxy-6-metoxy-1,4-benzoquinol methylase
VELKMKKTENIPWQLRLYYKSLMKKEKVSLIKKHLQLNNQKVLDLGCAQGVVSFFIKQNGGEFSHADLDQKNIEQAEKILKTNVSLLKEGHELPYKTGEFDTVIALDILEHVSDDSKLLDEIARVLKPEGQIVLATPISGKFFILNKVKKIAGLKPEIYGHKREGYSLKQLEKMLIEHNFKVEVSKTYAKFFMEFFELILNILYIKKNRIKKSDLHSGAISPTSEADMNKEKLLFKIYANLFYPFVYLITRLDKLLFFKTGYATFLIGRKQKKC